MLRFIAFLLLSLASVTTLAATPYKTESIMLLQPDYVLQERTSSVEALSNYIKAVQAASESVLANEPPSPTGGYLVLAIRPGGQSMTWLDFQPALPAPLADRLKTTILAVPPFQARKGVVVFALKVSLWDAPPIQSFPNPTEWSKVIEGRDEPMEIGDLVDKVWPAQAGTYQFIQAEPTSGRRLSGRLRLYLHSVAALLRAGLIQALGRYERNDATLSQFHILASFFCRYRQ